MPLQFGENDIDLDALFAEEDDEQQQGITRQRYQEDFGFFETIGDVAAAIPRGVAGALQGVYGLVDALAQDILPDAPENFGLGGSKTMAGGMVESIVQFGTGFVPGLNIASKLGKIGKIGKAVDAGNKAVRSLQAANRNVPALLLARGMEAGKYATAGAIADFTVFDGHEQRLSNMIQMVPELQNPVTEFLAADEEDSELTGRMKTVLEGAGLGVAVDAVLVGLRAFRAGVKALPDRQAASVALEQSLKEQDAAKAAAKQTDEAVEETVEAEVKQTAVIDDDLKQMTKSQLREEAKKHPGVKRNGKGVTVQSLREGIADARAAAKREAGEATEQVTEAVAKQADETAQTPTTTQQADEAVEAGPEKTADEMRNDLTSTENSGGTLEMVEKYLTKRVDEALKQSEKAVDESSLTRETAEVFDEKVGQQFKTDSETAMQDAKLIDEATGTKLTTLEVQIRNAGDVTEETRKALINNRYRMGAIRELLTQTRSRLESVMKEAADDGLSKIESNKKLAEFLLMQKNFKTLSNNIRATQSEFGRNLQSIQRGTGDTRAGRLARDIAEESPLEKFSLENLDQKEVVDRILDISGGEDAVRAELKKFQDVLNLNPDTGAALKYARGKAGVMGAINEWWMNSILSGPTTMIVNLAGGLTTTLLAPLERATGQALAGNFQNAGIEFGRLLAIPSQIRDSLKVAKMATMSGEGVLEKIGTRADDQAPVGGSQIEALIDQNIKDTDTMGAIAAKWMARNVVNAPGKFLAGTDEFFKQLNYRTTVKAELYKRGVAERVVRPDKLDEWVEQEFKYIVDDGQFLSAQKFVDEAQARFAPNDPNRGFKINEYVTSKMRLYNPIAEKALATARDATFTTPLRKDRGALSGAGKMLSDITGNYPVLRIILPFVRTPTNVMQYVLERVPLAGSSQRSAIRERMAQLFADDRAALQGVDQEAQAEALGRLATGMTLFTGATVAAMNGGITGGGPQNNNQRKLKEQTGWQAYSIKIGDSYISYQRLDPFASFFGITADLVDIMSKGDEEQRKDAEDLALGVMMAISKNITSKTYLKGIKDFTGVLFDPEMTVPGFARRTAASFAVPNLFAQVARSGSDPLMDIKNMTDALKARVPGLSDSVPHRRNMLGEEIMDNGTYAAVDLVNPFSYSTVKDDKMMQEFDKVGHGFSAPRSLKNGVELRDYFNNRDQSAYDRWLELSSGVRINGRNLRQELRKLMSSRQYKRLPYEPVDGLDRSPRARLIQSVLNKYRSKAYAEMLDEFPEVNKRAKIVDMIKTRRRVGQDYKDLLRLIED
ncbi:MAG: hypothetical protein CMB34_05060 [Euryarchaeota archaeon]|nr:hypothetical protein [Euryarchaeota archaeon]